MKQLAHILILSLFFKLHAYGQLFVKIEKSGTTFSERIYPGKLLEFKTTHDEDWRQAELIDIIPETQLLLFDDQVHELSSIVVIRDNRRSRWSGPLGTSLMTFGLSWNVYAGGAHFFDETFTYTKRDAIIGGTTILSGYLLQRLIRYKTIRLDGKYRLRIIDMRI